MKTELTAYFATLVVFVALDFVWLSAMGSNLYRPTLKDIMLDGFRPVPAILFYLIFVAGLVYFVVRPGVVAPSWGTILLNGSFFGLCAYATYDLSNHATLRNWTTTLTVVDMVWGALLSGVAALIGVTITNALLSAR